MTSRHSMKRGSWIAWFVAFRPMRWPRKRPSRVPMGSSSVCATAMEMGPWMRPWCLPMDYHPVSAWWRQEAASSSHVPPTSCISRTVMRTVSPTYGKFCSQVSKKGFWSGASILRNGAWIIGFMSVEEDAPTTLPVPIFMELSIWDARTFGFEPTAAPSSRSKEALPPSVIPSRQKGTD